MSDPRFEPIRAAGGDQYQAFLDAGYREWYSPGGPRSSPYLLQKAIGRDGVRLYFVNVWAFDFRDYGIDRPVGYSPEVQFNIRGGQGPTFNVVMVSGGDSPGEIEAFFARVYDAMGCEPYGD